MGWEGGGGLGGELSAGDVEKDVDYWEVLLIQHFLLFGRGACAKK